MPPKTPTKGYRGIIPTKEICKHQGESVGYAQIYYSHLVPTHAPLGGYLPSIPERRPKGDQKCISYPSPNPPPRPADPSKKETQCFVTKMCSRMASMLRRVVPCF